jgi:hypothetical protein
MFLFMVVALPLLAQEPTVETDIYFPQRMTAKELLLACSSSTLTSTGRQRQRYCYGFVSGVEESLRLVGRETGRRLCVPAQKSSRELAGAYIRYAARKNIDLGKPAAMVVVEALEAAFPCATSIPGG